MVATIRTLLPRLLFGALLPAGSAAAAGVSAAEDAAAGDPPPPSLASVPGPESRWPMFLGAQDTFIDQKQTPLDSPYQGKFSLDPQGDRESTNTIGIYTGWAPWSWGQLYFDAEKFSGAGVSGATGLGGLTNGDVVREGGQGLNQQFYIARLYARFMLPLGSDTRQVARGQDQIPGWEPTRRLELKAGRLSVADDFDKNRYSGSTRTQFLNWSLWQNTAWDYAADTRGYTDGFMLGYISPSWSLRYGLYRMPLVANGQTLEPLSRAREQDLELTLSPGDAGTVVRILAYYNVAAMGDYREALAIAQAGGTVPDVAATGREGRHKFGFGLNAEQPLGDGGDTGLFMRLGWDDAATEDFAFTEVDRLATLGGQLSGVHWRRRDDRVGVGLVSEGLSAAHRNYLAAGGSGFLLGDGRLNYDHEKIVEAYYCAQWSWPVLHAPLRLQITPDIQYIQNPGFNRDRGPVRFYALRLHLEY
jgi:hypothetical protein